MQNTGTHLRTLGLLTTLGLVGPVTAASAQAGATGTLTSWSRTEIGGGMACATLNGAEGSLFALFAANPGSDTFDPADTFLVGVGALDAAGNGRMDMPVDVARFPAGYTVELAAVYMGRSGVVVTEPSTLLLSAGDACETLDFDFTLGEIEPVPGQAIDDEWSEVGLNVSAVNATAGHPDLAIVFDGANPSGEDTDLFAPSLGKLLIVAEDAVDGDGDGLVDDPDDERFGGTITFGFDDPVEVCSLTIVDVDLDEPGGQVVFTYSDSTTSAVSIDPLGDNSIQTLSFSQTDVVRMDVQLAGSAGLGEVRFLPCPYQVNFDERSLGAPLDLRTGEQITNQFSDIGLTVSAINANPTHPSKAILFDTANPTGGDTDLVTPGYGFGNDTPLGKVLILAENDVDANADGLVDDPDDEEAGGQLIFDFTTDVVFFGATVLDVDGGEFDFFEAFDGMGNSLGTLTIPMNGDNSVQKFVVDPPLGGVRKVVLNLDGSGAVSRLRFCPEQIDPQ